MALTGQASSYLEHFLQPLQAVLTRPDVTDIYINRPGEVWVEQLGGETQRFSDERLDEPYLWRLARQVAHVSNQGLSPRNPLLSAALPDGARIQVVAPPACHNGFAIAIRRHLAAALPLASYSTAPSDLRERVAEPDPSGDYAKYLAWAVGARKNILISGGTSSGKTTLLNSLLAEIPASERLITIEDTPELQIAHPNSVRLVAVRGGRGEAQVSVEELLQASLRMRPDRIILGELRGSEAFTFLRAINTGHPGSVSTLHADSPERALVQLAMMSLQAGLSMSYDEAIKLVRDMVDVVVQTERSLAGRRICDVQVLRG